MKEAIEIIADIADAESNRRPSIIFGLFMDDTTIHTGWIRAGLYAFDNVLEDLEIVSDMMVQTWQEHMTVCCSLKVLVKF